MHVTSEIGGKMKTFRQYAKLRETTAMDVGRGLLGNLTLSSKPENAIKVALQGFIEILAKNPQAGISLLRVQSQSEKMPELKQLLQQNDLEGFNDPEFRAKAITAAKRIMSNTGLADIGPEDIKGAKDTIARNSADSFQSDMP